MRRAVEHRDHQLVHLVAVHVGDKALIDANDVDPLVAELIERIDVMPEAVDDQPAALLLQFAEKCPTLRGVLQYCGLIDAEQQRLRRQRGSAHRFRQVALEVGAQQAVDGQRQRERQPFAFDVVGIFHQQLRRRPAVDVRHQAVQLRGGDERLVRQRAVVRRHHLQLHLVKRGRQRRRRRRDGAGQQPQLPLADDRLYLLWAQQFMLPFQQLFLSRFIQIHLAAPVVFGGVAGDVGLRQQLAAFGVAADARDAGAGADAVNLSFPVERVLADLVDHLLHQRFGLFKPAVEQD